MKKYKTAKTSSPFTLEPSPLNIPCVILSGGKSSRMGEDKSLLPFDKYNTMIEYQYKRLKPFFKETYISAKQNKFDFEANIIYDNNHEIYSPMVALEAILKYLKNDEKIFIITVDAPLVQINTILDLYKNSSSYEATVAVCEEKIHNLCGIFSHSLYKSVTELLNNDIHKINYLLRHSNTNYIQFPENGDFANINDKTEYQNLLSYYKPL
ncbi:molybdenum cofactor guanylyltransferase MobA [Arcobacter sp. FWKO B]|uniref:molybdenum cofactor guanylyltransferase MobA n=1 Tax=Arcobacter sp. FWKO B TaxID=2593672 RepID=UPI0018A63CEE|nr:molybdenum cofactor guanylyltransferase MobA [Arcobacter sp. FWKO B]QOG12303.1 molybdenum cofactor guanylyltransferase MobA [Arcobacter sp. FWKO B]